MAHCATCESDYADALAECPACVPEGEVFRCSDCGEEYPGSESCPWCGRLRSEAPCEAHADRTAEGRCIVCGRSVCRECNKGDRHAFVCTDHSDIRMIGRWAQIYTTTSEFEAQLILENLHAEGVDAQIFSQKDRIFSVDLGELSIVRLLVPVWEYAQALELMRTRMDTEGEVVFACPGCGEAYEPGARECTGCGAPLV
jgi:hypothetical protein